MAFIATNVELISLDENPDRDLNRYEFFEILLRIATEKFKRPGISDKYSTAFKKLLNDHIYKYYEPIMPVSDWRYKELWTLEVEDVLRLNLVGCQRLFN